MSGQEKTGSPRRTNDISQPKQQQLTAGQAPFAPGTHPAALLRSVRANPGSISRHDIMQLQCAIGNRAVIQLFKEMGAMNDTPGIIQKKGNNTGLPGNLKTGVENLSGVSLDDVKVHYNSPKPLQLQALAYTRGTDIYVGPGQEKHLAHEAWHVVQQRQGRVKPAWQAGGVAVNDDRGLEREADVMGKRANQMRRDARFAGGLRRDPAGSPLVAQRQKQVMAGNIAYDDETLELYLGDKKVLGKKKLVKLLGESVGKRRKDSRMGRQQRTGSRYSIDDSGDWLALDDVLTAHGAKVRFASGGETSITSKLIVEGFKTYFNISKKIEEMKKPPQQQPEEEHHKPPPDNPGNSKKRKRPQEDKQMAATDKDVVAAVRGLARGDDSAATELDGKMPELNVIDYLTDLTVLLFGVEPLRNPLTYATTLMLLEQIEAGKMTWEQALGNEQKFKKGEWVDVGGEFPMSHSGATTEANDRAKLMKGDKSGEPKKLSDEVTKKEFLLTMNWLTTRLEQLEDDGKLPGDPKELEGKIKKLVEDLLVSGYIGGGKQASTEEQPEAPDKLGKTKRDSNLIKWVHQAVLEITPELGPPVENNVFNAIGDDWLTLRNWLRQPKVTVNMGGRGVKVSAQPVVGGSKDATYDKMAEEFKNLATYLNDTTLNDTTSTSAGTRKSKRIKNKNKNINKNKKDKKKIEKENNAKIAADMEHLLNGKKLEHVKGTYVGKLKKLTALFFGVEPYRNPRTALTSCLVLDKIKKEELTWAGALATWEESEKGGEKLIEGMGGVHPMTGVGANAQSMESDSIVIQMELKLINDWLKEKKVDLNEKAVKEAVKEKVREYLKKGVSTNKQDS